MVESREQIRYKEKVVENLSHLSGASSEPSSLLIRFSCSDMSKVDQGGGVGCAAPGSMSVICLSPVYSTTISEKGSVGLWSPRRQKMTGWSMGVRRILNRRKEEVRHP